MQSSAQWQAKLEACQRRVVEVDGSQGGGVQRLLRHFSFVQPRFESFVGPRRKYVCLLTAIAMLLCNIANDPRQDKRKRERAVAALDAMTPQDIFDCGLAADFSEVCLAFLREFDVDDRDPAASRVDVERFVATLHTLFVDGYILCDSGAEVAGLGEAKTLTQVAFEQCAEMRTFHYNNRVKVLWSRTAKEEVESSMAAMRSLTRDTAERLQADFSNHDLYLHLGVFDLRAWSDALAATQGLPPEAPLPPALLNLLRLSRRCHEALGLPYNAALMRAAVQKAVALRRRLTASPGRSPDNRAVWRRFVDEARFGAPELDQLRPLILFYLSAIDGTGSVERGLGRHRFMLAAHVGAAEKAGVSLTEACLEVFVEGPQAEEAGHLCNASVAKTSQKRRQQTSVRRKRVAKPSQKHHGCCLLSLALLRQHVVTVATRSSSSRGQTGSSC